MTMITDSMPMNMLMTQNPVSAHSSLTAVENKIVKNRESI